MNETWVLFPIKGMGSLRSLECSPEDMSLTSSIRHEREHQTYTNERSVIVKNLLIRTQGDKTYKVIGLTGVKKDLV